MRLNVPRSELNQHDAHTRVHNPPGSFKKVRLECRPVFYVEDSVREPSMRPALFGAEHVGGAVQPSLSSIG